MPGPFTIPVGEYEGRIALRVPIPEIDLDDDASLARYVAAASPGIGFAVLDGEIPWADPRLSRQISILAATPSPREVVVWAQRSVADREWPAAAVWTVVDATILFSAPRPTSAVLEAISELHALPRANEIVVCRPHLDAISATTLDDLALRLDALSGWVYADGDDARTRAVREASRAVTSWGVRDA